jgi:HPt (histidine-containing phosphotransfer) domain-containing protein
MAPRKDSASVATYADHEVITVDNTLRKAISNQPYLPDEEDPVACAEKALAELSGEFGSWMESECARLDTARNAVVKSGFTSRTKEELFHAAHDIKGEVATFGYPAVASAADSLCRLIEYTPDVTRIPMKLVVQHVDAVRAIYREYARSDAQQLATMLTVRLREVTDEFLLHENRDRPDVIEQIKGPSLVPESQAE